MERLHFCEKCKKPVLSSNEVIKENKYYHNRCLNPESSNNENDEDKSNFAIERRKTITLKTKYSLDYFGKTLMTEVVRPYYQFHYKIKKNKYLELIPRVALYFHDLNENKAREFIKKGGLEKMKSELKQLL